MKTTFDKSHSVVFLLFDEHGIPIDYCVKIAQPESFGGNAVSIKTGKVFWCSAKNVVEGIPDHIILRHLLGAYGEAQGGKIAEISRRIDPLAPRFSNGSHGFDLGVPEEARRWSLSQPRWPISRMNQLFRGTATR